MSGYRCSRCGELHTDLAFSYHAEAPDHWYQIPEAQRDARTVLSTDQCEIDGEHFFVRGLIQIPVIDGPNDFRWGVWVSLSPTNYQRMMDLWYQAGRESEPPYFGWLQTQLPLYPPTLNLKAMVHTRPVGMRPLVELEPTDHPLAVEQRQGITMTRVQEIAEQLLHS